MSDDERGRERLGTRPAERDDVKPLAAKIAFFQYIAVGIFVYLITGFWDLQVRNPELYHERAERNRIKALPILAPRGRILDREGRVLVDSHSSFSLILSRENLEESHLKIIADGLRLDFDELSGEVRRFDRTRPKYEPIIIKEELAAGELAFVEAHRGREDFPEMELIPSERRLYPRDGLAAHVTGYVGEISEAELNQLEFVRLRQGDIIGKAGIERQYNSVLMGIDGQRRVVVDSRGRERQVIGTKRAVPGRDLQLTLDLDLQVVAELAMENRRGAVVALDPRNGEVLAMVSRPAFDANRFAGRIRTSDWKQIAGDPENPLLNRAIQAQLAPGSTFKPFVALAALELGVIDESFEVYCNGGAPFYDRFFRCHRAGGHGRVGLYQAIAQSCDVFFYNVGNRLGIDAIARYAELAGFGRVTGVDLPHEASGLVPSTRWKVRTMRQRWYAGETISVAIGQGALTVTPLQLAHAIGGLSLGGVWHRPHLVRDETGKVRPRVADFNVRHAVEIVRGMWGVVNDGGTGARARLPGIEVCGKTGTAQLASNEVLRNTKLGGSLKDNAWFVGFAPHENPEIVVAVLFEGGEHGQLAAPIARDVLKCYFDKKAKRGGERMLAALAPPPGRR
jgi:penicillin-binding protein 2